MSEGCGPLPKFLQFLNVDIFLCIPLQSFEVDQNAAKVLVASLILILIHLVRVDIAIVALIFGNDLD